MPGTQPVSSGNSQGQGIFVSLCEIWNLLYLWKSVVALAVPDFFVKIDVLIGNDTFPAIHTKKVEK